MPPPACCRRTCRTRRPTARPTRPTRPVLIYAIHSDAMPVYRVDDYAYTILAQKLSTHAAASRKSRIFGQKPYAVHVQVNPAALAARGIGLEDVRTALATATVNRPKGNLKARTRSSRSTPTTRFSTPRRSATSSSPSATARRSGSSDIADVVDAVQNERIGAWFDDKPAEGLAIQREAGRQHDRARRYGQGADAAARRNRCRLRSMSIWSPTARW